MSSTVRSMALTLFAGCLILAAVMATPTSGQADGLQVPDDKRPGLMEQLEESRKPIVQTKDGWTLKTEVLQPGTRSQGYHGVLYHDGEVVTGSQLGQIKQTPLGVLRYGGSKAERKQLWAHSGWQLVKPAPGVETPGHGTPMSTIKRGNKPPGAQLK